MSFPEPKPGLVIRYAFLWSSEADRGSAEAAKDRPCAIVVAAYNKAGAIQTIVAPVTHSPPLNRFLWPGYDLRPRPDDPGRWDYGMLPKDFFDLMRKRIIALDRDRKNRIMKRD
ncbi:hypothetical protein SAMN02982989_2602 [Xaviernesmea oryzae]|uniref:Type II toxin-antitoxin system PemK/MazF family toxin n=1 Tax=Xaviernesmea oryzae TaxID=464029 RepID=A0A1X7FA18_9HYPH|nr:hypothetical protein [Xaviernesmea oryzae]SMF48950.1 hypothetical protein SAMN02982989_2602 [Xaviernesmea oryzae]